MEPAWYVCHSVTISHHHYDYYSLLIAPSLSGSGKLFALCWLQDGVNDYECLCVPGYQDKNCETDVDECETGICKNHGNCTVSTHYIIMTSYRLEHHQYLSYVSVCVHVIYLEHKWLVLVQMYRVLHWSHM